MAEADKTYFPSDPDDGGPLIEPIPISDTFATGVELDYCPDFVRLTYWVEQPAENRAFAPLERQAVTKIAMPRECFERAVERLLTQRARRSKRFM